MPRTPAIYGEKLKWRVAYEEQLEANTNWAGNYHSGREKLEVLEQKIMQDMEDGRMLKMSHAEATKRYGEDS